MDSAEHIKEMVDFEVEEQKKKTEAQTMTDYFKQMLPWESQEIARKSARRSGRVLRRNK